MHTCTPSGTEFRTEALLSTKDALKLLYEGIVCIYVPVRVRSARTPITTGSTGTKIVASTRPTPIL